jgi:hypothetical protein
VRPALEDRVLVEAMRRFGAAVGGRAFTMREFDRWSEKPCRATTIDRRLGGWRRALGAAGFVGGKVRRFEAEELVERLERAWRTLGRPPGVKTIGAFGVSCGPYQRHWGSLRRACVEFARYARGEITRERLLAGECRSRRREGVSPRLRWTVLERDGHRCAGCGRSGGEGAALEIDHIVPVAAGGGSELSNLRVLCAACNRGRGAPGVSR